MLPNTLSRLPQASEIQADIDDSFPDDFTSGSSSDFAGHRGPQLAGQRLSELSPGGTDRSANTNTTLLPLPNPNIPADLASLKLSQIAQQSTTANLSADRSRSADRPYG